MSSGRIAFVVQRYGEMIGGGAEYHCRVLAEHLTDLYDVDVLTTCANSYTPWDNYFESGTELMNGVKVRRFPVERIRDSIVFAKLTSELKSGNKDVADEWINELGPFSPQIIEYLQREWRKYKAVIFFTYVYYHTLRGLRLCLPNAILLPTAHDEPNIYLPVYQDIFGLPAAYLYNSIEERLFLEKKFQIKKPSRTGCVGIDIPECKKQHMPELLKQYVGKYICYVGRVSNGKNYREFNRYFIEYKYRNPSDIKLVVVGKIDERMNLTYSSDIIYTGFLTDDERTAVIQNSILLVNPSRFESLSLVILESMAAKRPVLVNGNCAVLKGQCIRSNAGLYYNNYFEFEGALNYILNHNEAYSQMSENGLRFVLNNYSWERIINNVSSLIEEVASLANINET